MYQKAMPAGPLQPWEPDELGLPKAAALALLLVGLIVALCLYASTILAPHQPLAAIQVTQAQLTTLPRPTPPPPPKVVPPPKPLPAVIPKPPPVASKIVVATKPPPPVRHIFKPVPKPVVNHTPPPPTPAPVAAAPQPVAPPVRTDGIPVYGAQMRNIIEANHDVPPALAQLGISGEALVAVVMAPDGHVVSASIAKSSGNPLIDKTALAHALEARFPAFNADMPQVNTAFVLHVDVEPGDDGGDGGGDGD